MQIADAAVVLAFMWYLTGSMNVTRVLEKVAMISTFESAYDLFEETPMFCSSCKAYMTVVLYVQDEDRDICICRSCSDKKHSITKYGYRLESSTFFEKVMTLFGSLRQRQVDEAATLVSKIGDVSPSKEAFNGVLEIYSPDTLLQQLLLTDESVLKKAVEKAFDKSFNGCSAEFIAKQWGKKGAYVQFNPINKCGGGCSNAFATIGSKLIATSWVEGVQGLNYKHSATLVLLGVKGLGTKFHVDWSSARNVAIAVHKKDANKELALWTFIHPKSIQGVFDWIRKNIIGCVEKINDAWAPVRALTVEESRHLKSHFDEEVILVYQHGGDVVTVPPGWAHCVINMEDCIKVAVDVYVKKDMFAYITSNCEVSSLLATNADDYMAIGPVVSNELAYFIDRCLLDLAKSFAGV